MYSVSVIIPAYNAEKYICECVDSVINQTLKEIEIIIIDDGSSDSTGKILDEKYSDLENVIIKHQQNKGLYATRKIGLSLASGEYVGWVDADDFVAADMFEKLYKAAKSNNSDLAICDYDWVPNKTKMKEKWFREYKGKKDVHFVDRNSQPWNKIVKKSLMEKLQVGNYFETCFDEIYIRILINADNPVICNEKLYFYRVSDNSMSSSYKNVEHYKRFIKASICLKEVMNKDIEGSEYWKQYFDYRIIYYRLMTMIVAANARDKESYQVIRRHLVEENPDYKGNIHFKSTLNENYGKMKAFIIGYIIPIDYWVARAVCLYAFR